VKRFLSVVFLLNSLHAVEAVRIWDKAPYNAFTDLVRFDGKFFCAFREGATHHAKDGAGVIRLLASRDGRRWEPEALVAMDGVDMRDPKLSITPAGELMMAVGAVRDGETGPERIRTLAYFSRDGRSWGAPSQIGETGFWLWRVTWHGGTAYSVGYGRGGLRLYVSEDGRAFRPLVAAFASPHGGNEASLVFDADGTAYCFLRRDAPKMTAMWGVSRAPYREWTWTDLGRRVGGPHVTIAPDGRLIGVVRYFEGNVRSVSVVELDRKGGMRHLAKLPSSNGDSGYAGMWWHEGELLTSYYSTHENRHTSIFLARWRPEE
jgi:hypothetical protein